MQFAPTSFAFVFLSSVIVSLPQASQRHPHIHQHIRTWGQNAQTTQEVIKAASRHPARAKSHVEAMASQVLKYLIYEREAAPPPPSLEPSEGMLRQNGRAVDATRGMCPLLVFLHYYLVRCVACIDNFERPSLYQVSLRPRAC